MPFPWNAYAQAALLQENKVIGLHYGLFFEKTTSYSQAQQSAIALLLNKLPVDPCHILLIDQNFDVLSSQIIEQGHTLHKISDLNINSNSKNIPLDLAELKEDLDVILRHESISQSDPLAIFNQALDLLALSGSLIVLDEFVFKPSQTEEQKLPLLNDFIALGERLGFKLIEQQDLSEFAAPTLDFRLAATSTHRENLLEKLNLTSNSSLNSMNRILSSTITMQPVIMAMLCYISKKQRCQNGAYTFCAMNTVHKCRICFFEFSNRRCLMRYGNGNMLRKIPAPSVLGVMTN